MSSDGENEDDCCECPLADNRTGFLKALMFRTQLIYHAPEDTKTWVKAWRVLRVSFLIGLVLYQLLYSLYFITVIGGEHVERSIVYFCWLFQSFVSMCFIVYWQRKGQLKRLVCTIPWQNVMVRAETLKKHRVCKTFLTFYGLLFFIFVVNLSNFIKGQINKDLAHYDKGLLDCYGSSYLYFISYVVFVYALFVWNTVLTFYVIVSMIVHQELTDFNVQLNALGEDSQRDEVADHLLEHYVKHVEIGKMIRQVDKTFEVYTFIMLGTNIPTTIFTLLSLFQSFRQGWFDVVLSLPDLVFCVIEICGLTLTPAQIYSAIRKTEAVVYANKHIWVPFNAKVYNIAQMFVNHCNQDTLGISLWGFAVVTKPLILTTTSLTLTYLTLLIEMNGPSKFGNFSALFQGVTNKTVIM